MTGWAGVGIYEKYELIMFLPVSWGTSCPLPHPDSPSLWWSSSCASEKMRESSGLKVKSASLGLYTPGIHGLW